MPTVSRYVEDAIPDIKVDIPGVEKLLRDIKEHKAPGPDSIPNLVLKKCSHNLAPAVTCLFQKSLDSEKLPKDWTDANVSPIFKKGDRHIPANYRPVSLTSVLSKLLEHIICHAMHAHFDQHHVLTNLNHGFRAGYSCETQLLTVSDELGKSTDNGKRIDVGVLDYSKAFDTVPHNKLLHKLNAYGIRGSTLGWIRAFLTTRHMRVIVEGEASSEAEVKSGVPQGTVLGPLLFLCHINDLPERVESQVRLFADDCLLYREINTAQDHEILQNDFKQLENWASDWGMSFNASKCYILPVNFKDGESFRFYQLDDTILQHVNQNPYLGLLFSKDMTWSHHITKMSKKASCTLGFLKRNLHHCPQSCRMAAYLAMVRSALEYGSIVWDPYLDKDINLIENIQKRSARFITGDYRSRESGSMTRMLQELNLPTLQQRRKDARLTFLFKISHGLVPAIPREKYLTP